MIQILGTGLSGLVGSRIIELNPEFNFTDLSLDTGYDILNYSSLEPVFNQFNGDVVIHLAAFTDTGAAWLQRGDKTSLCYWLNVEGTKNIVDLCQKHHKYLIYISTDFVFDGQKTTPYIETDQPHPIEWYGETKYLAEQLVTTSGIPAGVVRIAFPYRAKFTPKQDLVRKIIDGFKAQKLYLMFTDQITTPTFIDDIAVGLKYFFEHQPEGIYHLVASSFQSPYDLALNIAKIFGFASKLVTPGSLAEFLKTQPPGSRPWQKNLALSNQKVAALGIQMRTLTQGLEALKSQLA